MKADFEKLKCISNLINSGKEKDAREKLIRILEKEDKPYSNLLNHLLREVGLYPYIDYDEATWFDKIVCELFKVDIGADELKILHREQGDVLRELIEGKNIVLSAPTSFGKSFIIDALIAAKSPNIVVIIVPTIALMDEVRRRLTNKFSKIYKIITTPDEVITEKVIFIFPQERLFSYLQKLGHIDLFIVDEFYKVSKNFDSERSDILLNAIMQGSKIAKQKYFLCPNIDEVKESPFLKDATFISKLDFNTVATNIIDLSKDIKGKNEEKNKKKISLLKNIVSKIGQDKTLIYAGSFSLINIVCDTLNSILENKNNAELKQFSNWLKKNYSSDFVLSDIVLKGIGIHNGRLHRSLTQIETNLFADENPLQFIISTSSLIEGVNTSASNVVMWQKKSGAKNLKYMDYKNLLGRSGRMFKHFVGNVYLLEAPIKNEKIELELEFSDDVQGNISVSEYEDYLSEQDKKNIFKKQIELSKIIGQENFSELLKNNVIQSSDWNRILLIAEDMNKNPDSWTCLKLLNYSDNSMWVQPLKKILFASEIFKNQKINYDTLIDFIIILSSSWQTSLSILLAKMKDKKINIDDYFDYEKKTSFYLATIIHDINELQKMILRQMHCDVSSFSSKLTYAFLPPNVYYLEEYGLPRMISRKIQNSEIINFEDERKKMSDIINEFLSIGIDSLIKSVVDLDEFDKKIIQWFYDGIQKK